jgi:pimeloyl-ACP methyl ester carboxylesterase
MPTVRSTSGVEIAVHDLGGSGEPLLVSHATGFHGRCYIPLAHALADRFHSVAFDYRGHGDTPRPDGPVDWQRYGDDALAMAEWLVEQNDGRPIVGFGHSMGGACLLMAAHRAPHLFRSLVVFEPIVFPPSQLLPDPANANESAMVIGARRRRATFPSYRAAIENYAAKPPLNCFTPESLRCYVEYGFRPVEDESSAESTAGDGPAVTLKCTPDTEGDTFATGSIHTTWDELPTITTPVTVLCGLPMPSQPSSIAAGVAERLPSATYVEVAALNHFGPMADPQGVADLIPGP